MHSGLKFNSGKSVNRRFPGFFVAQVSDPDVPLTSVSYTLVEYIIVPPAAPFKIVVTASAGGMCGYNCGTVNIFLDQLYDKRQIAGGCISFMMSIWYFIIRNQ